MSRMEGRSRLSEDTRLELSFAAMAHERRNRPLSVLIVAVAALLLMAMFAGFGIRSRGAARAELRRTMTDQALVERYAEELAALERMERDPSSGRGGGRPIPNLLTRMEELAVQAGLEKPRPPRVPAPEQRGAIRITHYHYGDNTNPITHTSLSSLLDWLRLAQSEELGMEVTGLNLRPDGNNWRMTVSFRRWEREG
jgi:hypothetical protein